MRICIPIYGYMFLWTLIPLVYGLYLGFTEYNGLGGKPVFVGLDNYIKFFKNKHYWMLLTRQIWIGAVCLFTNYILSFLLMLCLNVRSRARGFFRSVVYIPGLAASAITSAVWVGFLQPMGIINGMLQQLGQDPIIFHYSQFWMVFWIAVYGAWKGIGPMAIIWLGGRQAIDNTLYEAAMVDGANAFQRVRHITIPGLRHVATYLLFTGIVGAMQMMDVIMFISGGNPYGKTDVLMYRVYQDGMVNFNMGMAGAEGTILGLVTMLFSGIYFVLKMKREKEE